MRINYLPQGEKKKLLELFEQQFGIEKAPGALIEAGNEKIRLFTGSLTREELQDLNNHVRIELVGLYAVKREMDFRISFDALFLFEDQVTRSVIELSDEEMQSWMKGKDLEKKADQGIYIMKWNGFMLGCGKSNGSVIFNYVPKNRRFVK